MQELRGHMKLFSSKQSTYVSRLPKSRQTQKDNLFISEQNKLQSRSGEEADHDGVSLIPFLLWSAAVYRQVGSLTCILILDLFQNLIYYIQTNLLKSSILTSGHLYIFGGGRGHLSDVC